MRSLVEYSKHISDVFESTRDMALNSDYESEVMAKAEIAMLGILKECEINDDILEVWNGSLINLDPNFDRISWLRQTGLKKAMRWVTEGKTILDKLQ